ncbi:hypothetical protein SAMN04488028_10536 [Reichenbachiella agariperforans]|uniref:Lipoprotein n=1 Tax=Reichenbachiella agariperforans TaxID=156994 RepID=A0A1M6SIQ3_REIAG|nr:hypothetical protein SAMN04488028_10536 [Reichenbachiella agariperforans]
MHMKPKNLSRRVNLYIVILLFSTLVWSCTTSQTTEQTWIKKESWKNELTQCTGYRSELTNQLDSLTTHLKTLRESEVTDMMGMPDQTLLYERGQKFFEYQVNCTTDKKTNKFLRLRFNALGYVNEVLLIER